jgi:hypothetical protein
LPTAIVPVVGKPVVDVNLICVPDPLLPAVSAANAPSKSFCKAPVTVPPYNPAPYP